jgi:SET domain
VSVVNVLSAMLHESRLNHVVTPAGSTVAAIGKRVNMLPSRLGPDAGNGLFARHTFEQGEYIAEYVGQMIGHDEAKKHRAEGTATHIYTLESMHSHLDGIKHPTDVDFAEWDWCWASLANDARCKRCNNATFVKDWDDVCARYRVYLVALRHIAQHEEILVSYATGFWHS